MSKNSLPLVILIGILALAVITAILTRTTLQSSKVVVEWETASELNTAGFNVFRGSQPEGINTILNTHLIPPSKDPILGGKYQFTDVNAVPGLTYYYFIEEVDLNGGRQRFGPIEVKAGGSSKLAWATAGVLGAISIAGIAAWFIKRIGANGNSVP